jgi:hypothetical protein
VQKSGVNRDRSRWFENAKYLRRGRSWVTQVFENIEGKNAIENVIAKGQLMSVANDVSVTKNLMLEFDTVWIACRGRSRPDMQDQVFPLAQNVFKFVAQWIAVVFGRNNLSIPGRKNRNPILKVEEMRATFAAQSIGLG